MNIEQYSKIASFARNKSLKHHASLKSIRNALPVVSFSPDTVRDPYLPKENSPKGWTNWNEDSSPRGMIPVYNAMKLPPIDLEIKRSQFAESKPATISKSQSSLQEKPNFRARGSIILEEPIVLKHRGSTIIEEAQLKSLVKKNSPDEKKPKMDSNRAKFTDEFKAPTRKNTMRNEPISYPNVITRCGYKTQTGSVMGKKKKHNQDNWLISQKVQGCKGQYLLAVCDGHGDKGHKVSALIRKYLPNTVEESLTEGQDSKLPALFSAGIKSMISIIEKSEIDLNFSGSTLTAVLIRGKFLVCGNIGDSRVIIGSKDNSNAWHAFEVSSDQKPSRSDEASRIVNAGGVIRQYRSITGENTGPLRVWSIDKDVPGLAMTRSIGDLASKKNGIISEPEMTTVHLTADDKFIIIATDGIWEFISSEEAVNLIKDVWAQGKSEACCEKLLQVSISRWENEGMVDDITVLVAFLNIKH